ncbi:DUF4097 family beta strand repeat-containing protein [Streptomyces sp. DSM 41527]|uniref:DUF4097 family beta strand repeat-containing protein n=1 Tax=Streptomyces mooreae TaxID=3075523 RepID=A0ABU2T5S8_9ACTN|nr:DUF4097 family beta strand repeat-containing protein [Streptomyces sp. DSM 41527]MDT0455690.1 DUF4097 family beta strand repeat-containing protein [Streptomyces sp. DSM 41527]
MPTFDTPEPISVTLEFDMGSARITASKRTDTVVEVRPSDATADADVRAAQQTKVTCSGGKLVVKGPKKRSLFGKCGSLDVTIELPAGSDVLGTSPMADITCAGRLGECRFKTSLGDLQMDEAETVNLRTDYGDIRLARVTGDAELIASGLIEAGEIAGAALVKNGNGATTIGEVTGALRATASNGLISVGVAHAGVEAKSANGAIRIGEVARGRVVLRAAAGDLEVGIRQSTAAWLDVATGLGNVRNSLGPSDGPGDAAETVEVRAHTSLGDIVIRRS